MKKIKKTDIDIGCLIDQSLIFSLYINIIVFVMGLIDSNKSIFYTISFLGVTLTWFLWKYFFFSESKIQNVYIDINADLNKISKFLYKNNFFLSDKIGDFYVYKSKNIILPSPKVFVKTSEKSCLILVHATGTDWIKKGLEETFFTKK